MLENNQNHHEQVNLIETYTMTQQIPPYYFNQLSPERNLRKETTLFIPTCTKHYFEFFTIFHSCIFRLDSYSFRNQQLEE